MADSPKVILVPVDGSAGALAAADYAALLASALGVPVRLLYAFPEDALHLFGLPPATAGAGEIDSYSPEHFHAMRDRRAEQVFGQVRAAIQGRGIALEQQLLTGDPATVIVEHAGTVDRPLIVMGRRGLSRFSELLMGSVSHRVSHHAACPVLIVNTEA